LDDDFVGLILMAPSVSTEIPLGSSIWLESQWWDSQLSAKVKPTQLFMFFSEQFSLMVQ